MKIQKKWLRVFTLTIAFMLLFFFFGFAQPDSTFTATATTVIGSLSTKFSWINVLINIVTIMATALVMILPGVQYILKKIPTTQSVKIGGFLGTVLNWATWFQDDIKVGGGIH